MSKKIKERRRREVKKILLGILAGCLIAGLTIPAVAAEVEQKAGDKELVLYGISEEEGEVIKLGGFVGLNLTQRICARLEFIDFGNADKKMISMISVTYLLYPTKYFSPHLGIGTRIGKKSEDRNYLQVVMGFTYKPWNLFAEAKFVTENTVDLEDSEIHFAVGYRF